MGAWRAGQVPGDEEGEFDVEEDENEEGEEIMDLIAPKKWKGRMIRSVAMIRAEDGRTYGSYLCVVFEDRSRGMLALSRCGIPYDPEPSVDEMRKAPDFYTPEEIAGRVLQIERKRRARIVKRRRSKKQQFEKLQRELMEMEE